MHTRSGIATLALLGLALALTLGCPQPMRPLVTLEQVARPVDSSGQGVMPPSCASQPLPDYPSVLTDRDLQPIAVLATFTVSQDGRTRDVTTSLLDKSEFTPILIRATESAIQAWRCEPALRPPRPDEGEVGPQPVESQTMVMFRFYSDESHHERTTL